MTAETQKTKGDMIDGMLVGLDLIERHCGNKKYKKRVFLITDGQSKTVTNQGEIQSLINQLNEKEIKLNVITLDFANELGQDSDEEEEDNDVEKVEQPKPVIDETKEQTENKELIVKITGAMDNKNGGIYPAHLAM